jgi:tryptophan-rich sensory protein
MKPRWFPLFAFLFFNFLALAIGSFFTGPGVSNPAYAAAQKAPWTPPGWFFGVAWTTLMIAYAWACGSTWSQTTQRRLFLQLYGAQWVLNVLWNPLFFYWGLSGWAWLDITVLFAVLAWQFAAFRKEAGGAAWGWIPYLVWLLVANSLNGAFVVLNS